MVLGFKFASRTFQTCSVVHYAVQGGSTQLSRLSGQNPNA